MGPEYFWGKKRRFFFSAFVSLLQIPVDKGDNPSPSGSVSKSRIKEDRYDEYVQSFGGLRSPTYCDFFSYTVYFITAPAIKQLQYMSNPARFQPQHYSEATAVNFLFKGTHAPKNLTLQDSTGHLQCPDSQYRTMESQTH